MYVVMRSYSFDDVLLICNSHIIFFPTQSRAGSRGGMVVLGAGSPRHSATLRGYYPDAARARYVCGNVF